MTTVINIRTGQEYDVYCGREGLGKDGYFGNSHVIGYCYNIQCNCIHNRKEAIEAYKKDFYYKIEYDTHFFLRILELKDKILGCFCKPLSCHCDIIADYLNNLELPSSI